MNEVVLFLDSNNTSESVSVSDISLFATVTELVAYDVFLLRSYHAGLIVGIGLHCFNA